MRPRPSATTGTTGRRTSSAHAGGGRGGRSGSSRSSGATRPACSRGRPPTSGSAGAARERGHRRHPGAERRPLPRRGPERGARPADRPRARDPGRGLGLDRRLARDRAQARGRGSRGRRERVLPRRHAQPDDGHGARRARGLPHPGRDARPRWLAGRAARRLRAGGRRRSRVRAPRGAARREPHDQVGDGAPLRELGPRARARRAAARPVARGDRGVPEVPGTAHLLLGRERRGRTLGVGTGALPGGAYAEDQLLGRERIEAGFAKVFHPDARVLHSHDYPPVAFFRRYFDEFRSLREVLGFRQPWGPRQTLNDVRGLMSADKRWLREQGLDGAGLVRPLLTSGRHHAGRMAGSIIGTRADRLPARLRRALSLEGRDSFTPYEVPGGLLDIEAPTLDRNWPWEFVRKGYPRRPLALEAHNGETGGALTIAWVVPTWSVGSGGHTTIFRLVRQMEQRGHRCSIHLFDPGNRERRSCGELRDEIRERFVEVDAPVFRDLERFSGADVAIATEWRTAFPVRDLPRCREKVYLVQDDEPQFYATSAQSIWAEESYRMGYRCIAYTPWMADILRDRCGLEAAYFECVTATDVYEYAGEDGRVPALV